MGGTRIRSYFVDDQVVIYDAKHPELYPDTSNRPDIIEIGIEAKLAFGTGNHETTRMIISQLLQMPIKTKRILDCGTGTGILGLTSSKLGAKDVVGYDIDEWSVEMPNIMLSSMALTIWKYSSETAAFSTMSAAYLM